MMWLLAEQFQALPEVGDLDKPKLGFFIDEAHLLFDGASKAFVEQVQRTVRLTRSKGVGVFFITQLPLASALTSLGVGEAVVTVLSPDGVPTPVAWTRLYPPQSRMVPADPATVRSAIAASAIHTRYGQTVDPDSAYERLTARLQQAEADKPVPAPAPSAPERERSGKAPAPGGVDTHDLIQMGKMALRFMNTPAGREIQRSIFGVLRRRR